MKFTIKEHLLNFELYPVKMNKCELQGKDQDYINCFNVTNMTTSFDKHYFCYTIFSQMSGQSDEKFIIRETEISLPQMVKIEVERGTNNQVNYTKEFNINLHDRKFKNYL